VWPGSNPAGTSGSNIRKLFLLFLPPSSFSPSKSPSLCPENDRLLVVHFYPLPPPYPTYITSAPLATFLLSRLYFFLLRHPILLTPTHSPSPLFDLGSARYSYFGKQHVFVILSLRQIFILQPVSLFPEGNSLLRFITLTHLLRRQKSD